MTGDNSVLAGPPNDFTSQPSDLASMGFPSVVPNYSQPGINDTYPNQNPAPPIASTSSSDSPGFFGSIFNSVEDAAGSVVNTVEDAPGVAWDATKTAAGTIVGGVENAASSGYNAVKSGISTVAGDVGAGANSWLSGIESHVFLIFGVAVVGIGVLLWSAGKSGALKANVIV